MEVSGVLFKVVDRTVGIGARLMLHTITHKVMDTNLNTTILYGVLNIQAGSPLSSSAQKTAIQNWMTAVKNRYSNIWVIDVVNEPIKTACPFNGALGGSGSTG